MAWRVEFSRSARKSLDKLPDTTRIRILKFVRDKVVPSSRPGDLGLAKRGEWSGHVRYRVGDYRMICRIDAAKVTVHTIKIGHRSQVYDP